MKRLNPAVGRAAIQNICIFPALSRWHSLHESICSHACGHPNCDGGNALGEHSALWRAFLKIQKMNLNCKFIRYFNVTVAGINFPASKITAFNTCTLKYPKSTLDLRCELLICVESGLQTPLSPGLRHSFCPITTRELWDTGQMQSDAGQKSESRPHCSLNEKAGAERWNKINYPPLIYG